MRLFALLAVLAACGDNIVVAPDGPYVELPSCASVGCPNILDSDKHCASTGDCTCVPTRDSMPISCVP